MMDSILTSIKLQLGITENQTSFDQQLIIHINSVFAILTQMGIGPTEGFFIEDDGSTWDEYVSEDISILRMVRTYIYMKVRMIFDPPSGAVMEALKQSIDELEFRLHIIADSEIQNGWGED